MSMNSLKSKLSRRAAVTGAATTGALAVVASMLPGKPVDSAASKPATDVDKTAGYQETPHVLHYYRTARI
jgi:hypothetical protein